MIFQVYAVKDELPALSAILWWSTKRWQHARLSGWHRRWKRATQKTNGSISWPSTTTRTGMIMPIGMPEMAYNLEIMKKEQEEKANASTNL